MSQTQQYAVEVNRLSDQDREAIGRRVAEVLRNLRPRWVAVPDSLDAGAVGTLQRAAYWSIGCNVHDLRDVELAEIDVLIRDEIEAAR